MVDPAASIKIADLPFETVDEEIRAMLKAGVHWGHAKSKNHPAMQPYIFGVRNTISVIDLIKTKEKLVEALAFLKGVSQKNGTILLVGTRPAARKVLLEFRDRLGLPLYAERWIGGTLTNFKEISKRISQMEIMEKEKATGEWGKYTKKEQLEKSKDLEKLQRMFDGVRILKRLPDALFIVDINEDDTALREARRLKIPVVALCDTNSNADMVTYPIPSNDDALPAVRYMIGRVAEAIDEGRKSVQETQ